MSSIRAIWYIAIYGVTALVLMAIADWRLARARRCSGSPATSSSCAYFVPRMRDLAKASSEVRSHVMGRVVDSYTNILTVKLFARARGRGRLRARGDRRAPGRDGRAHAAHHAVHVLALGDERAAAGGTAAIGITLWAHGT